MAVRKLARKVSRAGRVRAVAVTPAQARAHVFAPAHVKKARTEEVDPKREMNFRMARRRAKVARGATVDLGAMGLAIWNKLKDNVVGYILQVRQNGTLVHVGVWNWAQTPADAGKGWSEDTRMHVASVSKFLTAVGTVKLLDSKTLSYDTKIIIYLPAHWSKGPNIDKITFRHLFTHTSGFVTGGSSTDYATMKSKVAAGVSGVGSYDYENMNFGLCRLLISTISGAVPVRRVFHASGHGAGIVRQLADRHGELFVAQSRQGRVHQCAELNAGVHDRRRVDRSCGTACRSAFRHAASDVRV